MPSVRRPGSPAGLPNSTPEDQTPSTPATTPPAEAGKAQWASKVKAPQGAFTPGVTGPRSVEKAAPVAPQPAVAGPTSLDAVFESLPSSGGGPAKARVLSTNLDAWNSRWDMLQGAKTSIDAQYFILEKDVYGYAFLGSLLEKQLDGVPVRLMTDAMADTFGKNGFKMPLRGKDYLQELVNAGAEASIYHPIWQRAGDAVKGDFSVLASNHDKILVVDKEKGVTGGRNIGIEYFSNPKDLKSAWRDMDVSLEGKGTSEGLTKAFEREFDNQSVARPVSRDLLGNWDRHDVELVGTAKMMDYWLKAPAFTEAQKAELRADPQKRTALALDLVEKGLAALPEKLKREPSKDEREQLVTNAEQLVTQLEARGSNTAFNAGGALPERATQTKIIDQTSAANGRLNEMAPALREMVKAANTRIVIENPYVVLTEDMLGELQKAAERGVKIDIITNSPLSTDSKQTQAFFLEDFPEILARCPTARVFVATGDHKFHTKAAVVDGKDAFISTYNLDLLSGYVNSELGAVVKSPQVATDLMREFDRDLADPANGFLEYKIRKDDQGRAVRVNGKPVVVFGPENHLPKDVLEDYKSRRKLWGETLREKLPYLAPLRHPGVS